MMTNELLLFIAEQMGLHNTHIVTHMGAFGEIVYEDKSGNEIPFNPSPDTLEGQGWLYRIETWLLEKHGVVISQFAGIELDNRCFTGVTREEAIFSACQWLYDNRGRNDENR